MPGSNRAQGLRLCQLRIVEYRTGKFVHQLERRNVHGKVSWPSFFWQESCMERRLQDGTVKVGVQIDVVV